MVSLKREMLFMSDRMYAPFAASQVIMNSIVK